MLIRYRFHRIIKGHRYHFDAWCILGLIPAYVGVIVEGDL